MGLVEIHPWFMHSIVLKAYDPDASEFLNQNTISTHSAGEVSVCIQPDIPQIFKSENEGEMIQVFYNQSDRSTMDNWENPDDVINSIRLSKKKIV
ncbi:uncharacterized protein PRCAT00004979001 [Priceomyces carsonii]|uniref:uncharacterized protein n=1 Tax=Priceomyces carsonii TaxID=28549 RepID=UPI002ED9FD77|nr:unnamed protein product [Priceomyces carsonii]